MKERGRLWHVTITLSGEPRDPDVVRTALEQLQEERPFLHSLRYETTGAEIQYWEEAHGMLDAASLALRVWNEHRASCGLPQWEVVGLEVLERDTFQRRAHLRTPGAMGISGAPPRPL
ncbi:MAG: hypothetical protein ACRDOY_04900 [Nocardioidaceae bacterium]